MLRSWALFEKCRAHPSEAFGVGQNEDPITELRGTEGCRRETIPLRIIPARGQVPEDNVEPPRAESRHVLHDRVARSKRANEPKKSPPQPGPRAFNADLPAGVGDVLAGKAADDRVGWHVDLAAMKRGDVIEFGNLRPVILKNGSAKWIDLHLTD